MNKSFTLIEIMIVVLTISILSSIIYVASGGIRERGEFAKVLMFSEKISSSLAENAVGQWDFDEGTGSSVYDSSLNENTGTITGATWETKNNCVSGLCLGFDGVDDYVNINKDLTGGLSAVTLSLWVRGEQASNLFLSSGNAIILHFRGAGFYLVGGGGTTSGYLGWQSTLPFNQWIHIVATWSNLIVGDGKMKLYVNGTKQSTELSFSGGTTNKLIASGSSNIGHYFNTWQPWFKGRIDEINLYDQTFTAKEIKEKYCFGLFNLLINNQVSKEEYLERIKLAKNE
ncbi:MAG: prepilin-type N-terminal cleavage/methylation domain-containing protein [Candidatus Pacebacteria bacterium]|nr:prepilin-type N-terminal cleavage/methylation domain-containing protein [Candidatus Paceibacterota bacterium]